MPDLETPLGKGGLGYHYFVPEHPHILTLSPRPASAFAFGS